MPTVIKSVTIPRQEYRGTANNPRDYGPYSVDQFTRDDVDKLLISFVYEPTWPQIMHLFDISLVWDDNAGGGAGSVMGFPPIKFGILIPILTFSFGIPKLYGVKRPVTRGDVSMKVYANFFTTITLEAIKI